jgi:hypothetical protein
MTIPHSLAEVKSGGVDVAGFVADFRGDAGVGLSEAQEGDT